MEKLMIKGTEISVQKVFTKNNEYCVLLEIRDTQQTQAIVLDPSTAEKLISALNKANIEALGGNLRRLNFRRLQTVGL